MKLEVVKNIIDGDNCFKIKSATKCCDEFLDCLSNGYIHLNSKYTDDETYEGDNKYGFKLGIQEDDEYVIDFSYKNIKYCPFCGEEIIINVIMGSDLTEDYYNLENKIDMLRYRIRITDSKSEERELRKEMYEIDREINNLVDDDVSIDKNLIN